MSGALLKTPLRQVPDVRHLLMNQQARDQLGMVAAKHMNPERMMRVVANAIRTTPKLGQCEPMSFLGALMQCAALGLEPNTILGHAYLIPFDNKKKGVTEVQLVVGYKGLIDLARRSGHITSLSANIHYSDDELWIYEEGTEAQLRHRPGPQKGEKLHAYAIAKFKDGGHAYVVLPWEHVIRIRDGSQGYQSAKRFGKLADSPWTKHLDEMAKKTAIRALSKYLPLSVEFIDAVQVDEARADYRAFAMDPTAGVAIEGETDSDDEAEDGETVDPETGEVTGGPAALEKPKPELELEAEKQPERKPAARRAARKEAPADAGDERPEVDLSEYQALLDRIGGELLDGATPQQVMELWAGPIASMRDAAPGIYKNLLAELDSYAPGFSDNL
ncbi:recombinase RecT [Paracoccus versutus]|uniref:Recombination protein RecT n=1 Tax=Paracoccus versutus TaxID=34007 RepID=A0A3D9XGQ0_PARVE|nr:recombinase RecT [Paracoccus versutus]REF69614.1 recombination protein RecT [Paracoccus versutus]